MVGVSAQTPSDADPPPRQGDPIAEGVFRFIQRGLLILAAIMTLIASGVEVVSVYERQSIDLADILLMFLYTEVIAMIAVFYTGKGPAFAFPIFIAITAIARLIVLQGKDMAPQNVVFESGAILLLVVAAVILVRIRPEL